MQFYFRIPHLTKAHIFPLFSSITFIILGFTFRSMIYFELIFVYELRFIVFTCGYSILPALFVENAIFFPFNCIGRLLKKNLLTISGSILGAFHCAQMIYSEPTSHCLRIMVLNFGSMSPSALLHLLFCFFPINCSI